MLPAWFIAIHDCSPLCYGLIYEIRYVGSGYYVLDYSNNAIHAKIRSVPIHGVRSLCVDLGDDSRLPCNALSGCCSLSLAQWCLTHFLSLNKVVGLSERNRQQPRVSTATSVPNGQVSNGQMHKHVALHPLSPPGCDGVAATRKEY